MTAFEHLRWEISKIHVFDILDLSEKSLQILHDRQLTVYWKREHLQEPSTKNIRQLVLRMLRIRRSWL